MYDAFSDWNMPRGLNLCHILPKTLCRCTGIYVGKGRYVYENDIVRTTEEKPAFGVVRFGMYNDTHYGFYIDWETYPDWRKDIGYWKDEIEVAGNVLDDMGEKNNE